MANGNKFRAEIEGNTISLFIDTGSGYPETADTTWDVTGVGPSSGSPGVYVGSNATAQANLDDWEGGDLGYPAFRPESGAATTESSDNTLTLTLPSNTAVGETVVMIIGCRNNTAEYVSALPAGWSLVGDSDPGGDTNATQVYIMWREVTASWPDGATTVDVTVTRTDTLYYAYAGLRFSSAADPDTSPPTCEFAIDDTTSTTPDPPSEDATGGDLDFMWVAGYFHRDIGTASAWPTNYTANQTTYSGANAALELATYNKSGASRSPENPSSFTTSGSPSTAFTMVIYPATSITVTETIIVPTGPLR
jgi:hypothetical protein